MQSTNIEVLEVNGVKYIKEGSQVAPPKPGKRAVVVVGDGFGYGTGSGDGYGYGTISPNRKRRAA